MDSERLAQSAWTSTCSALLVTIWGDVKSCHNLGMTTADWKQLVAHHTCCFIYIFTETQNTGTMYMIGFHSHKVQPFSKLTAEWLIDSDDLMQHTHHCTICVLIREKSLCVKKKCSRINQLIFVLDRIDWFVLYVILVSAWVHSLSNRMSMTSFTVVYTVLIVNKTEVVDCDQLMCHNTQTLSLITPRHSEVFSETLKSSKYRELCTRVPNKLY